MNTKLRKTVKIAAAGLFLLALAINVKVTLDDPFTMVSEQALATGGGEGEQEKTAKCYENGVFKKWVTVCLANGNGCTPGSCP